ncbi:MAG: peptidylprolyl isomerase, partial [Terriglobales bacterium]
FIPRSKQITNPAAKTEPGAKTSTFQPPTEAQKKAGEEAMAKLAPEIRARAAKGEDPDKLQKEVYVAAGLPGSTPNTKMERVRRTNLPPAHQVIMDLKPGEVSEVISDTNSGYYIYKMISEETLTLDNVKPEIERMISSQRYRDSMKGFQGDVELNDAYFGPSRNPGMMQPSRGPRRPAQQDVDPD